MEALRTCISSNKTVTAAAALFLVLAIAYSLVTKLKYGPDEPAHFIYIRCIGADFALPRISHQETKQESFSATHEGHQPPLYYAVMAVPYALLRLLGATDVAIWRALRLLNIPLGVVYLCAVYALALELFGDRRRAARTAAFVVLIPTSPYTFAVVNNENMISPLFNLALVAILRYFKSGLFSRGSAVATGVLIGLSALAKAQGLALVPLFLIAAFAVCRRDHYANWRQVLSESMLVLGTASLVGGWWYVRNYVALGVIIPQSLHNPVFSAGLVQVIAYPEAFLAAAFGATCLTYGYFWTPFWLIQTFVGFLDYLYVIIAATAVIAVGVVLRLCRPSDLDRRSLAFLTAAPVIVYVLWLRHALFVDAGANMQGRLFLSTAGVAGIGWLIGVEGLAHSDRARSWLVRLTYAAVLVANAGVIACGWALYSTT